MPDRQDHEGVWVISDLMPDGSYGAVIQYGPDLARPITQAEATEYVAEVLTAGSAADYDAGVYKQLTGKLGSEPVQAASIVHALRGKRGRDEYTAGLMTLTPGVSALTGKPYIRCQAAAQIWQWSPRELLQHVTHVIQVTTGVENDNHYYALLTEFIGIDEERARNVVNDLGQFLQQD